MTAIDDRTFLAIVQSPLDTAGPELPPVAADEIAEFRTAPRDGRQVLAWNGRAWEIVQFDTRSDRWESTYRGRGCELVDEALAARFTLWAPLPVVVTW